jgi:hypothetical protein
VPNAAASGRAASITAARAAHRGEVQDVERDDADHVVGSTPQRPGAEPVTPSFPVGRDLDGFGDPVRNLAPRGDDLPLPVEELESKPFQGRLVEVLVRGGDDPPMAFPLLDDDPVHDFRDRRLDGPVLRLPKEQRARPHRRQDEEGAGPRDDERVGGEELAEEGLAFHASSRRA